MKISKLGSLALLACTVALTGCLERQFQESAAVMSVDTRQITVPSDMFEGRNLVKDTLYVTSNRSWSAIFENDVDWVTMDTTGHQDMARISEITPLVFSFKDNETDSDRSVNVRICSEDGDKTIELIQEALSPRLVLTSSTDGFGSVRCDGDTLGISINSNVEWTVALKAGSDASVKFTKNSGKYSADLEAIVLENTDLASKSAGIVISAEGCRDIEIPLGQLEGIPYFRFDTEETAVEKEEGIPNYSIPIRTNSKWTASVLTNEGFHSITVPVSGTKADRSVKVEFPYCADFDKEKGKMVIRFTAEGVEGNFDFTIEQKPCIRIWWWNVETGKVPDDVAATNFSYPPADYFPNSAGDGHKYFAAGVDFQFITHHGFVFDVKSLNGLWKNSSTSLMFGGAIGDFIQFPAIEGHKLVTIKVRYGGKTVNSVLFDKAVKNPAGDIMSMTDQDGKTVDSIYLNSADKIAIEGTYTLIDSEVNTRYSLVSNNASNFMLGDLILHYE